MPTIINPRRKKKRIKKGGAKLSDVERLLNGEVELDELVKPKTRVEEREVKEKAGSRVRLVSLVDDWLRKKGLIGVKAVAFTLPSEGLGSKTSISKEGGKIVETRILNKNYSKIRTLRREFYNYLHKVAFKADGYWYIIGDDPKAVDGLNKVVRELNTLVGTRRKIYIMPTYVLKEYIENRVRENIIERELAIKNLQMKIKEGKLKEKELKRLKTELSKKIDELKTLRNYLNKLKTGGAELELSNEGLKAKTPAISSINKAEAITKAFKLINGKNDNILIKYNGKWLIAKQGTFGGYVIRWDPVLDNLKGLSKEEILKKLPKEGIYVILEKGVKILSTDNEWNKAYNKLPEWVKKITKEIPDKTGNTKRIMLKTYKLEKAKLKIIKVKPGAYIVTDIDELQPHKTETINLGRYEVEYIGSNRHPSHDAFNIYPKIIGKVSQTIPDANKVIHKEIVGNNSELIIDYIPNEEIKKVEKELSSW